MNGALQIAVDLERGEIRLGSERVRLLSVAGDVFCLNDARGPLVRALKFEERSMLLANAGDRDVASLVADAALISSGVASDEVRIAASLALAGGGEQAPAFPECMRFVEQHYGWDEKRIGETIAVAIDKLCRQMVQQDANGWKQIVFQNSDADLGTLISKMATNLSQRAVALETKANTAPPTTQKSKQQPSFSTQVSQPANNYNFRAQQEPSSHVLCESVSPVLPVRRAPFRVLAVNTDQAINTEAAVGAASIPDTGIKSESQATIFSKLDRVETARPRHRRSTTTIPTTPQSAPFATAPKLQADRVNFSLSQQAGAVASSELLTAVPPVVTFPAWQPLATLSSNTQPSSQPARTSSRVAETVATDTQSVLDWLAEVAQLLEAECDMRGIDP